MLIGTCESYADPERCGNEPSRFESDESKCYWEATAQTCSPRPIDSDLVRVVLIALVSAVLSTPMAVLFQSIIMFVLSADTDWHTSE